MLAQFCRAKTGIAGPLCPGYFRRQFAPYRKGIIDSDAEVSDGVFDFGSGPIFGALARVERSDARNCFDSVRSDFAIGQSPSLPVIAGAKTGGRHDHCSLHSWSHHHGCWEPLSRVAKQGLPQFPSGRVLCFIGHFVLSLSRRCFGPSFGDRFC
jgi:hypothetical protein